jgi:hypothetical protein
MHAALELSAGLLVGDGMPGNWTTNVLPHPSYAFGVSSNGQVLLIAGGYPLDISLSEDGGTTWRGIHLRNAGHSADIAVSGDGSTMVVIAGAI